MSEQETINVIKRLDRDNDGVVSLNDLETFVRAILDPDYQPTVLVDCGAICAMLERATGRAPDIVLGKPDPTMLAGIVARHRLAPAQVAMVGDRVYTDIRMAQRAGAFGVLVLSGEATAADAAAASPAPDLVLPSLAEFGTLLADSRRPI